MMTQNIMRCYLKNKTDVRMQKELPALHIKQIYMIYPLKYFMDTLFFHKSNFVRTLRARVLQKYEQLRTKLRLRLHQAWFVFHNINNIIDIYLRIHSKCSPWDYVKMTHGMQLSKVWKACFLQYKSIGSNTPSHKLRKKSKKKRYWKTWTSRERWQEHYNLVRFDNSILFDDFIIWSYTDLWKLQRFPIGKDSTIKNTSIWQRRFWKVLFQEFSTVPCVTHSKTS